MEYSSKLDKSPLVININTPLSEINTPNHCCFDTASLSQNADNIKMTIGITDCKIVALVAVVIVNPKYIKVLKQATLNTDNKMIIGQFFKISALFFLSFGSKKGEIINKANNQRISAITMGDTTKCIERPNTKLPAQNNVVSDKSK